jgi:hypothetical protein
MTTHPRSARRRWLRFGPPVAIAALLAGCGSSGGGAAARSAAPTTTPPPPTTTPPPTTSAGTTTATAVPTSGGAIDPAVGVTTSPVRPLVTPVRSTFEGFAVSSYVPHHPVGIVYLFDGTGGSANFATKLDTVDVLNTLTSRGYGFVSTESTNRTTKRWNLDDPSMTGNPDLARLARLRQHIVDATAVDAGTPTFGIGMSNGSAFVALWATTSTEAGMPVRAIGMYMAGVSATVRHIGGVRVPTFMVVAQNDTITLPQKERRDLATIVAAGIPTELHEVTQRPVTPARYLRIPGVNHATAEAIVAAYRQAGFIDANGNLAVALPRRTGPAPGAGLHVAADVELPTSLTPAQQVAVNAQTLATIGEHQFNAEFKVQNADFFDAHRTA